MGTLETCSRAINLRTLYTSIELNVVCLLTIPYGMDVIVHIM